MIDMISMLLGHSKSFLIRNTSEWHKSKRNVPGDKNKKDYKRSFLRLTFPVKISNTNLILNIHVMGLDFRDSCKSGEPRTVGLQSEARYLKIFWIINVSTSTKWFLIYLIPGRKEIWKCWFLRRGENRSTRRKTSRSKGENQQQTQLTYGVDAGIWTRATLVGGERSHHWAGHPCSQPLLINVEIQLVPVYL